MTALKKLFAVAFAFALPLAATAQAPAAPAAEPAKPAAPLYQIYGTLNVNLHYTEASDATAPGVNVSPRTVISTDSSNIGVRGTLEVAHGLKVVYQCETGASVDGEVSAINPCNRNSRIGLSGDWGTVFYGNWDTPFKSGHYTTKADDPFGNTDVFGFQGLMGSPGSGVKTGSFTGSPVAGFDLRAANSIAYWSPKVSGVSGKLQYSVDEQRDAVGRVDPLLLAAAVNYDMGGFSVVAAAEYHEDAFGIRTITGANTGTSASKDLAWRVAAGYEIPLAAGALTVMGMFEQLSYEQEGATDIVNDLDEANRMAWLLGAKFRTGNHELRARYTQALEGDCTFADGSDCPSVVTDGSGAQHYALGYAYHLAKTAQVYAFYTQIVNDEFAQYSFGVAGAARVTGTNTPVGSDPLAVGLGMRYAF